jgi:hypothetical protein
MNMEENKIVIYQSEDGQTQIDVRLENETVWLTQSQMAELFQTDRTSIVRHINNIYKADELEKNSTCAKIAQVQIEGKRAINLVALTLMIAESKTEEKDIMVKVDVNLINQQN